MQESEKSQRRNVSIWFLVILGLVIGFMIKNVEIGLIIAGSLAGRR
jgi:hypothetical protein